MASDAEAAVLPTELSRLSTLLDERIENFVSGDREIQDAALQAAKYVYDLTIRSEDTSRPYLKDILDSLSPAEAPRTRSQARAGSSPQKRQPPDVSHAILEPTPLKELYVSGMDEDQIWAQLELKVKNVCDTLQGIFEEEGVLDDEKEFEDGVPFVADDEDEEMDELEDMGSDSNEESDLAMDDDEDEDEDEDGELESGSDDDDENDGMENVESLRDPSSDEGEDEDEDETRIDLDAPSSSKRRLPSRKGHKELDDGFFNLAEFNAEIEEAEARKVSRGALSKDSDDDDSDAEEDVDLFAPVDDAEAFDEEDEEDGSQSLFYRDFFDPPPKKAIKKLKVDASRPRSSKVRFNDEVKVKMIKNRSKGISLAELKMFGRKLDPDDEDEDGEYELDDGEEVPDFDAEWSDEGDGAEEGESASGASSDDGREAIERLKDDLFADDEEDMKKDMSTYEARMAEIREQIAALEAENVAEKDWVLKGEATARARPKNSLLEEDLEYERVTKPVPVVTEEAVQDLESRIKARILEGRFDDVVRRKPVDDKPFLPSRIFELQDTKSKESLAQIYENEYMAAQTGSATDDRDGKLKKEHEELEKLWDSISYKLDALCNAHFTPKQPKAIIQSMSNVSTVALESALPTSTSVSTVLAPEEVFAANPKDLRARSELTPKEAQALRNKERKKKKKQRQLLDKSVDKFAKANNLRSVKKQKEEALKSVVKNGKGVTVIGKKSQDLKRKGDKASAKS